MTEANAASLFKKGDTQKLASYRPIALLNYTYKILASVIQQRLAEYEEQAINYTRTAQGGLIAKLEGCRRLVMA